MFFTWFHEHVFHVFFTWFHEHVFFTCVCMMAPSFYELVRDVCGDLVEEVKQVCWEILCL